MPLSHRLQHATVIGLPSTSHSIPTESQVRMTSSALMAAAETLASVAAAAGSSNSNKIASAQDGSAQSARPQSSASPSSAEPKKRTRPVSACEACRAKKVRCLLSPDAPVCQNCLSTGKQCLFRVDDLAPALRASRFAHCGPPGANARTLTSKKAGGRGDAKSKARLASSGSSDPSPPQPKRTKSSDSSLDARSSETPGIGKQKAKAVFRSYANPSNLAAPLPTTRLTPKSSSPLQSHDGVNNSEAHHHSGIVPSRHEAYTSRDFPPPPSIYSRPSFGHDSRAAVHGSYPVDALHQSQDAAFYGQSGNAMSGHIRPTPATAPSVFLQQNTPSDGSGRSNHSAGHFYPGQLTHSGTHASNMMPPERKSSISENKDRRNSLREPMSLDYYGNPPPESHFVKFEDKPVPDTSTDRHSPSHRVSAELRDGIERWQRRGASRPEEEVEEAPKQEEPLPPPRPKIVLPFFRWFGTTANTPGYRKIKVGVLQDSEVPGTDELAPALEDEQNPGSKPRVGFTIREDDELHTPSRPGDDFNPSPRPMQGASPVPKFDKASSSVTRELFEINRPRYPRKDILEHLVALFLSHFKPSWCPWMENEDLTNGVQNGTMPAILANAVCAVAARFSDKQDLRRTPRKSSGDAFSEMSKILIIPLLSFPSIEVIEALILLSYAEFAAGSDSGLWMYVGMALRMAQDLGLQHEPSILSIPNEKNQEKARLLFWAVVGLDRITTFGTGRPVSIRESEIDVELPRIDPNSDMTDETVVFGHVVRILMLRGRMGELLNLRDREDSVITVEETKRDLTRMWYELAQSYSDLPANLHFNVQTFQQSAAHNQSPGFVYLHVLFQSTIGLLDRPALMKKFTTDSAPLLPSFAPAAGAAASRTIADILTLGDAFDDRCIIASPYLDQLVLPAGRSFVAEREAAREALRSMGHGTTPAPSRPPSRDGVPPQQSRSSALVSTKSYADINLGACQRILQKLQRYWAGASWPLRALEQEASGNELDVDLQASDEDAQSAPIRDVEMVLKWAKSRIRFQKRMARSAQATPRTDAATLADTIDGLHKLGNTVASDEFASTHSGDSPFGLGISAGLTFDIEALMGSWQMDQFDPLSTFHPPTSGTEHAPHHATGQSPYSAAHLVPHPTAGGNGYRRPSISVPSHVHTHQPTTPSSSTHLHPSAMVQTPQHHATHHQASPQSAQSHSRHGSMHQNAGAGVGQYHFPTPGQLDTSSFAIAEFFSHDQSVWPLSIQNEEIDQEAVNLITSALQLPSYQ